MLAWPKVADGREPPTPTDMPYEDRENREGREDQEGRAGGKEGCLLYTSPSPRD